MAADVRGDSCWGVGIVIGRIGCIRRIGPIIRPIGLIRLMIGPIRLIQPIRPIINHPRNT